MTATKNQPQKKTLIRDYVWAGIALLVAVVILILFPEKKETVITVWSDYFFEMMSILPAIMIIMGLFSVWVSKDMVMKYLGKTSGLKGMGLALLIGMLPTGPLYIAFPIAAVLLKSGASVSNIIIFLSAWACIKLPQELMELQFLGLNFMLLRLGLSLLFIIIMGLLIEWLMERLGEN